MAKFSGLCRSNYGFTLIELSIVLVIIGLIVGGVLVGRDLIKTAELRSVITQQERYITAVNTFMGKYSAMPGDMVSATSYWGAQDPTPATCITIASATMLTCNGDGDGQISYDNSTPAPWEGFRAWQHLANAGLIEGRYNGIDHGSGIYIPNVNQPSSRFSNSGWSLWYLPGRTVWGWAPETPATYVTIGGVTGTYTNRWFNPVLKPEDAYSIDLKIDDGKPYTGKANDMLGLSYTPTCTTDETTNATYQISLKTPACLMMFKAL